MIVAMTGCFDLFHSGHKEIINKAIDFVGREGLLFVLLNTDESVKRLKGKERPIDSYDKRKENIENYIFLQRERPVLRVLPFETEESLLSIYQNLAPDLIVHGADIKDTDKIVGFNKWPVMLVPKIKDENGKIISTTAKRMNEIVGQGK